MSNDAKQDRPAGQFHYLTLDAMRGVAALAVMLFHARTLLPVSMVHGGYLAVDFFFVLSGFVIAKAYDHRLGQGMTFAAFMEKRLIRFYPLALVGLAIAAAYEFNKPSLSAVEYAVSLATALFFLPSPMTGSYGSAFPFNGPRWSLFFELLINAIYAAFHRHMTDRVLKTALVVGAVGVVAVTVVHRSADVGNHWSDMVGGAVRVLFSFAAGVLLYRHRGRFPKALTAMPSWLPLALLFLGIAMPVPHTARWLYDIGFVLFASPALVMAGASAEPGRPLLTRPYEVLGALSFALYAIHMPILHLAEDMASRIPDDRWAISLGFVIGVLVLAYAAAKVDEVVRLYLTRALSPRLQATAV